MLYVPSIWGDTLMDDWMNDFDRSVDEALFSKKNPLYGKNAHNLMKTDVREHEDGYELDIDLPGFKKEEIELSLQNGYLTIQAAKGLDKTEEDKKTGRLIRQERYAGSMSRSFYVGKELTEEDIKAKMEHGVLSLTFPKAETKKVIPAKKTIAIE